MGLPSSNYFPQDQQAWLQASEKNTIQAYTNYVTVWPEGRYTKEAERRLRQIKEETLWNWAKSQQQAMALEQYLEQYPEGFYSIEAYELISRLETDQAWSLAQRKDSVAAYLEFRRNFPDSSFADEAAQRIVSLVKSRSGNQVATQVAPGNHDEDLEQASQQDTIVGYNQFLRQYPHSPHKKEVVARIDQLQDRLQANFQALEDEVSLWDQTTRLHSRYAYQEYLSRYPEGKFSSMARNRLLALDQQWQWKHRVLIEGRAQGRVVTDQGLQQAASMQGAEAAWYLGWLWLGAFLLLGGLCLWLANYLLPMTIVVALAVAAHVVLGRGAHLTRRETFPYLIGGTLASGALVQGLAAQTTNNPQIAWSLAILVMFVSFLFLVRFFQGQMEKKRKTAS